MGNLFQAGGFYAWGARREEKSLAGGGRIFEEENARVMGRIFALCRSSCALLRVGAWYVFAESLRRLVGRFCAKSSRGVLRLYKLHARRRRPCSPVFGRFPSSRPANEWQLARRDDGVECRALRRFGRETCPETPHGCRRKASALGMQSVWRAISEQARKERVTGDLQCLSPSISQCN